jgi:hypothetical protein
MPKTKTKRKTTSRAAVRLPRPKALGSLTKHGYTLYVQKPNGKRVRRTMASRRLALRKAISSLQKSKRMTKRAATRKVLQRVNLLAVFNKNNVNGSIYRRDVAYLSGLLKKLPKVKRERTK